MWPLWEQYDNVHKDYWHELNQITHTHIWRDVLKLATGFLEEGTGNVKWDQILLFYYILGGTLEFVTITVKDLSICTLSCGLWVPHGKSVFPFHCGWPMLWAKDYEQTILMAWLLTLCFLPVVLVVPGPKRIRHNKPKPKNQPTLWGQAQAIPKRDEVNPSQLTNL